MELTQLRQFLEVANTGNLTRAAEKLYVSQPALSKAMQNLERELGFSLFDRTKNQILLNNNGRIVQRHVKRVMAELSAMEDELHAVHPEHKKQWMIFSSEETLFWIYISLLNELHPEIRIRTNQADARDLMAELLRSRCDIALGTAPLEHPKIISRKIGKEVMLLRVPRGHPFAEQCRVSIYDLNDTEILVYNGSFLTNDLISAITRNNHAKIHLVEFNDPVIYMNQIEKTGSPVLSSNMERLTRKDDDQYAYLPITGMLNEITIEHYISYLKAREKEFAPICQQLVGQIGDK